MRTTNHTAIADNFFIRYYTPESNSLYPINPLVNTARTTKTRYMRYSNRTSYDLPSLKTLPFLFVFIFVSVGCATRNVPRSVIPPNLPNPPLQAPPSPSLDISWAGTSWVILDKETKTAGTNYKGFHFAKDGTLLLINFPHIMGKEWSTSPGNLKMITGSGNTANNPLNHTADTMTTGPNGLANPAGSYSVFEAENPQVSLNSSQPMLIRLTIQGDSPKDGLLLQKMGPAVDLVENLWTIRTVSSANGTFTPVQSKNELIILPNAGNRLYILAYNHSQRFRAPLELSDYFIKIDKFHALNGPNHDFEELILNSLVASNHYVQVGYDLFLYSGTRQKLALTTDLFN